MSNLTLGQSGSLIQLIDLEGKPAVLKSEPSNVNASRLHRQYEKHLTIPNWLNSIGIYSPEIVLSWREHSYAMEYIHGSTLGDMLSIASRDELQYILEVVEKYFTTLLSPRNIASDNSMDYLQMLETKLSELSNSYTDKTHTSQLAHDLIKLIQTKKNEIYIPIGWNHGDFSFENLMVSTNFEELWCLDFLDSPIETPLIDFGRFLLDCEFGWWYSSSKHSMREAIARRALSKTVRSVAKAEGLDTLAIDCFLGFAALRIFPYTKSPQRRAILIRAFNFCVNSIEQGNN